MKSNRFDLYIFSGTGNSLLVARKFAEEMTRLGNIGELRGMESGFVASDGDAALGLAMPVACFSTYPTVWRFIDSLPNGGGREAFMFATMGGVGGGMEGPIGRALAAKDYLLIGSRLVRMPGNYNNKFIDAQKNSLEAERASREIERFARELTNGSAQWGHDVLVVSRVTAALAHTRMPWNAFYKVFPLRVDMSRCNGCGICERLCPEHNIVMNSAGTAEILDKCQSCQRCIAFCPASAIGVPGKQAERYRSVEFADIETLAGKN